MPKAQNPESVSNTESAPHGCTRLTQWREHVRSVVQPSPTFQNASVGPEKQSLRPPPAPGTVTCFPSCELALPGVLYTGDQARPVLRVRHTLSSPCPVACVRIPALVTAEHCSLRGPATFCLSTPLLVTVGCFRPVAPVVGSGCAPVSGRVYTFHVQRVLWVRAPWTS